MKTRFARFVLPILVLAVAAGPALAEVSDPFLVENLPGSPKAFASQDGDLLFLASEDHETVRLYRKTGDEPSRVLASYRPNGFTTESWVHVLGDRIVVVDTVPGSSSLDQVLVLDPGADEFQPLFQGFGVLQTLKVGARLLVLGGFPGTLHVTDGTPAGTTVLVEESVTGMARYGNGAVLGTETALRQTDGVTTTDLVDLKTGGLSNPLGLFPDGERVFFVAVREDPTDFDLYVFDGAVRRAAPENLRIGSSIGIVDGRLVFGGQERGQLRTIWTTAGTPESTVPLLDMTASWFENRARLGSELWFTLFAGFNVRTDGTPDGTRLFTRLPAGGNFYDVPGHLLYVHFAGLNEAELWVTDGADGTRKLHTFAELGREFHVLGDRVFFAADSVSTSDAGYELWAVDLVSTGPPPPPPPLPGGTPSAPRNLRAEGGDFVVWLRWDDTSDNETRFVIQERSWDGLSEYVTLEVLPADSTSHQIVIAGPASLYRVRAENSRGASPWTAAVPASGIFRCDTCPEEPPPGPEVLTLQDGRFWVEVYWRVERDGDVESGRGTAHPFDFSDDSGAFWFFDEDNLELVVKTLDAREVNGFYWNFYGGLSDVEYWVVVRDDFELTTVTYYNPPGEICGQADTNGFPRPDFDDFLGWESATPPSTPRAVSAPSERSDHGSTACVPDADTLCLTPDRFRVSVTWRDQRSGDTGVGHAIPGTSDSGYFWFFDDENVELVVKVLDARTVNGFHWVFYGALTDVEYTLTVTDTATGTSKDYVHPPGNLCGNADVTAF